jgi:hypothetical protein
MAYRSLAAPWIGGASNGPAPASNGGYRSFLAFWAGGASGLAPAAEGSGYRSLLAFWIGGAADGEARNPEAGGGRKLRGRPEEFEPTRRPSGLIGGGQQPQAQASAPASSDVAALLKALAVGPPGDQFAAFVESLKVAGLVSPQEVAQAAGGVAVQADKPVPIRINNRLRMILAYWALS